MKEKSVTLSKLLRYDSIVFDTLKSKCERETRFGKAANFFIYILYRLVRTLKAIRHKNQKYLLNRMMRFITPKVWQQPILRNPMAPWHFPLSDSSRAMSASQKILIVAELSIPQCKRYRVDQKAAALISLGYELEVISFTDEQACLRSLPFAKFVIFYRTPFWTPVKRLIDECKRLGIPSLFDIDDLVFSVEEYRKHPKLQEMSSSERDSFLKGAEAYRDCLGACDYAISSTQALADWMQKYIAGKVFVLENAFDDLSIRTAQFADNRPEKTRKEIIIGYGSGTNSHDHDFQLVSAALIRLLGEFQNLKLVIHGYLNLSQEFEPFMSKITRIPFLPADAYLQSVADFDINLAPLETSVFNDAKSNIKFIEAALVSVPTVASPSRTMAECVEHGKNGFLASTSDEWYSCLRELIQSARLRSQIGAEAKNRAWQRYSPEATRIKFQAVLEALKPAPKPSNTAGKNTRILSVNVFYSPFSFGGATILLEKLMGQMEKGNADLAIFACNQLPELPQYALFKYEVGKTLVYSCKVEGVTLEKSPIHHPELAKIFEKVLSDFQPDIVHFHAIQGMGVELLETAKKFHSKVVVTAHDAWWICARQFMMREDKTWCGQSQIDLRVCASCTGRPETTYNRSLVMSQAVENADLVLAPSIFHKDLLDKNLPKSVNILVNKNGVDHPSHVAVRRGKSRAEVVRFAFIGGLDADHKGYDVVVEAFQKVTSSHFELLLVDLHQKLGRPAAQISTGKFKGKVTVVPPFDHNNADKFYSEIDVLLAPSRIPESFGIAVREAVLNGCHVIASRMGGVVEDLDGLPEVHFLEAVTTEHLLATINSILTQGISPTDPLRSARIVSPNDQAQELINIYKDLLDAEPAVLLREEG